MDDLLAKLADMLQAVRYLAVGLLCVLAALVWIFDNDRWWS